MSQHLHLSALLTIDTAFTLYMGKVMGSPRDEGLFPTPQMLHDLTFKLLSKAERNYVEKKVDDNGVWNEVPAGKGSIWDLKSTLAIADYCTENMDKIQISKSALPYAYNAVIKSRVSTKGNPKKLTEIHIIPALLENEFVDEYPEEIMVWIDRRFQYVMPPLLKYLKEQGVPAPTADGIQIGDWEELVNAEFQTLEEKQGVAKEPDGGEIESFSEMTEGEIEIDLMATGGDEHISLFASDFTGTYYLQTEENVAEAKQAQKILKGYWDLFEHCSTHEKTKESRQTFLSDMAKSITDFKERISDQNTGAGIVILD